MLYYTQNVETLRSPNIIQVPTILYDSCHESLKRYNPFVCSSSGWTRCVRFCVCMYVHSIIYTAAVCCCFDDSSTGPSPWHTLRRRRRHLHNPSPPLPPPTHMRARAYTDEHCISNNILVRGSDPKTNGRWLVTTSARALGQKVDRRCPVFGIVYV